MHFDATHHGVVPEHAGPEPHPTEVKRENLGGGISRHQNYLEFKLNNNVCL